MIAIRGIILMCSGEIAPTLIERSVVRLNMNQRLPQILLNFFPLKCSKPKLPPTNVSSNKSKAKPLERSS